MSLGPENVKRTWAVREGVMQHRMDVVIGKDYNVAAVTHNTPHSMRVLTAEYIEQELQERIMRHIRSELFPR